jgi:RNA polymerase sigma-70 factor (ECF subfamily)
MDDFQLITKVISGDHSAAEMFVVRYSRAIMGVFGKFRSLTKQDAEDLLQEVFGRLFEEDCAALRDWRGGTALAAYIKRIARNMAVDHLRARSRQPQSAPEEDEDEVPDSADDPETAALIGDLRRMMHEAIGHLTRVQRAALVAVDIEGLSYAEAANRLGVTVNTLAAQLNSAREALRRVVEQKYPALKVYLEGAR